MPAFTGASGLFCDSAGSNYPLRAGKATLFEGGVRGVGVLGGGALPGAARGKRYGGLAHAVDVAPTLVEGAGVVVAGAGAGAVLGTGKGKSKVKRVFGGDGVSFWPAVLRGGAELSPPLRSVVPLDINGNGTKNSAIIVGDLKLILKPSLRYDGYYPAPPAKHEPAPRRPLGHADFLLFNLTADPRELHDLSADVRFAAAASAMVARLGEYVAGGDYNDGQDMKAHILARPGLHNGVWAPWVTSTAA